jgi:hypothetical protein
MGIFYAHTLYGALTPCIDCNSQYRRPTDDLAAGSGAPFFIAPQKTNLISSMLSRNKIARTVNNSSSTSTPDCESVASRENQLDFSKFNDYFTDEIHPCELIECLQEMRESYLNLSLHALMDYAGMKPGEAIPHEDVRHQAHILSRLISLVKELQQSEKTISKI